MMAMSVVCAAKSAHRPASIPPSLHIERITTIENVWLPHDFRQCGWVQLAVVAPFGQVQNYVGVLAGIFHIWRILERRKLCAGIVHRDWIVHTDSGALPMHRDGNIQSRRIPDVVAIGLESSSQHCDVTADKCSASKFPRYCYSTSS